MALKIGTFTSIECGVGIRAPSTTDIEIGTATFRNTGINFDLYLPPLYAELGLPAETPTSIVNELIKDLALHQSDSEQDQHKIVESSKLTAFLKGAGLTIDFGGKLISCVKTSLETGVLVMSMFK